MSEEKIGRYVEIINEIKQIKEELKPLNAEKKLIEEEMLDSGETEFSYYGTKITIVPKTTEKMIKEEVEALIASTIKKNEETGDGLTYEDFYEVVDKKKISVKEQKFDNKGNVDLV